ncbi:hypothetical protein FACS1894124_5410 [Spirochaetia bacterium]|nr:hypothetical protein FACS1894124_5410 [Spirochaetia bacterium]
MAELKKLTRGRGFALFTLFISAVLLLACSSAKDRAGSGFTVHYYRYTGDYEGWNLWVWPSDPNGNGETLSFDAPDTDGYVTATVRLPEKIREFGMIVKKSADGNDWAEKDTGVDRFTQADEVWLVQNDPAVYTEKPSVEKPPMLFAVADSADTVTVVLLKNTENFGSFSVYENGKKLTGSSAKGKTDTQVVITLSEQISDVSNRVMVRDESGEFGDKPVTMRNILDGFYYGGGDLGLSYGGAESGFKVWAPTAKTVSVALYDDAGKYNANGKVTDQETAKLHKMERDPNTGVWSGRIPGNLAGKYYLYRLEFADGRINWGVDPYAKAVSANGQRGAIVNLADTNPPNWKPAVKPPFSNAFQDAVLYELHVRDFSLDENSGMKHKGKFLAFTERGTKNREGAPTGTDHLVNLGITHVHLLPSFDFASTNELTVDDPASTTPNSTGATIRRITTSPHTPAPP